MDLGSGAADLAKIACLSLVSILENFISLEIYYIHREQKLFELIHSMLIFIDDLH